MAETTRDILEKLVGFRTISSESNRDLIDWVRDYLAGFGVEAVILPSPDGKKANLYASIGPDRDGGIILSGHSDVVPVADQAWSSDPFQLTEREGRLYGRGSCDMKGFVAAALAAVPEMVKAPLARPLHIAISYDEEVGCLGAPGIIETLGRDRPKPSMAIVGEPTDMKVVSAHKGITVLKVTVTGYSTHSSQTHRGVSAVMMGARLVEKLDAMARGRAVRPQRGSLFDPPYTTIHVGRFQGGTAVNIIAGHAEFFCDIRTLPEENAEDYRAEFEAWYRADILPVMRQRHPGCDIVTEVICHAPGLQADPESEAERFVRAITGDNGTRLVPFATEAGQFQAAGIATVVIGPGSIDQAHQPDEFVEIAQLDACDAFLRQVIDRCR